MKRIILVALLGIFMTGTALAGNATPSTQVLTLYNSFAVSASGAYTTTGVDVSGCSGYFNLQATVSAGTGYTPSSGTLTIGYQMSNDGTNWVSQASGAEPLISITSASGPSSDGNIMGAFVPAVVVRYFRFYVHETGGSHGAKLSLNFSYR